jgi:hypothetical protein
VVVQALLGLMECIGRLGRWRERAEVRAHRGGDNGGLAEVVRARGKKGNHLNRRVSACGGVGASPRS